MVTVAVTHPKQTAFPHRQPRSVSDGIGKVAARVRKHRGGTQGHDDNTDNRVGGVGGPDL